MTEAAPLGPASAPDLAYLRETIEDAWAAARRGAWPFAAQIVAADGTVLARTANAVAATDDPTAHAEVHAIRLAARGAGRDSLRGATLYASAEPCAMCAAAIHWAGIAGVFFGVGEMRLRTLYGARPPFDALRMTCREVFATARSPVRAVGPLLEELAAGPHLEFWTTHAAATANDDVRARD